MEGTPSDGYADLPGRGPDGSELRMHYRDWGGELRPIVLLHGLASSCRIWDLSAPLIAGRYRVIAIDQRGHGLTDRPDSEYTLDEVCGDLAALLDVLGFEQPLIVGHSWGANVALQFAADYSERLRGLVLVDGGMTEISASSSWEEAEKMMRPPDIDGVPVERFLGFARNFPHMQGVWSPKIQEMLLSSFLIEDGKVYRRLTIENHMKIARAIYDQKASQIYEKVRCPVLLIPAFREPASEQEEAWQRLRDDGIKKALEMLPAAKLRVMENTPHDVPVFRPEHLASDIVKFARGLD